MKRICICRVKYLTINKIHESSLIIRESSLIINKIDVKKDSNESQKEKIKKYICLTRKFCLGLQQRQKPVLSIAIKVSAF